MSAPYKASFALAPSNTSILPGSLCNDLLIWTGNSNQNILFGVSNVNTYMSVSGNGNMSLSGNVAFSNQLQLSGIMLTQRTSAFTNNVTSSITSLQGFAYVNGDVQITMSNVQSNAIRFLQNSTEYMQISSNGFVGIGTSNPGATLDVNGNIKFNNGALVISSNNSTIGFLTTAASAGSYANNATSGDLILRSQFNNVHIVPNQQTLGSSILCACSNGYVGIGKANPSYMLDVNGNINCTSNIITNSNSKIYSLDLSTNATGYYGNTSAASNYISYMFSGAQNSFNSAFGAGHVIIKSGDVNPNGVIYGAGTGSILYASDLILGGGVVCTGYGNNGSVQITGYGGNVKLYPGWSDAGQINNPGNIIFYKALGTTGRGNVVNAQGNTISGTSSLTNPTSYYNQVYQGTNASSVNTYSEAVRIVGSTGYIGIGTSNPTAPLTVIGTGIGGGGTPIAYFLNSNGIPLIEIGSAINSNLYINYYSNLNYSQIGIYSGSSTLNITSSNIGINISNPIADLDVLGAKIRYASSAQPNSNAVFIESRGAYYGHMGLGFNAYTIGNNIYNFTNSNKSRWAMYQYAFATADTFGFEYSPPNAIQGQVIQFLTFSNVGSYASNSGTPIINILQTGSIIGTGDNTCIATYGTNLGFVKKAGAATVIAYNNLNPFKISMMSQSDVSTGISTATFTDRLVIDNSGYVGIGTSSPQYSLDIENTVTLGGQINTNGTLIGSSNRIMLFSGGNYISFHAGTNNSQGVILDSGGFFRPWGDNLTGLGIVTQRWTSVYSVNGAIQTSDELDKNYIPLTYGLSDLMKVSTIKYKWKSQDDLPEDDPKKNYEYFGICARELNELFPELVYNEQEPYQVNYSEIIPVCINAIKDLKKEKDDEISILRQEIENMKIDIAALRKN